MFNEKGNWGEKPGDGRAAVAVVSGGRVGIFGARTASTHRHTLTEDIGLFPRGTRMLISVQSWHGQTAETLASAKWVCGYPGCREKHWASKEALYQEHGDQSVIASRHEAHCIMAISWAPEDTAAITGVMAPGRGQSASSRITVRGPHGLNRGDQVTLKNVMGRHDAMAGANDATHMLARVQAAQSYKELGDKKKAQEILDSIDFAKGASSSLIPLSVNGSHLVYPVSQNEFDIAQELNGAFVLPGEKDQGIPMPIAVLRPRRPILLSDVE
jgi:hypothetical protein